MVNVLFLKRLLAVNLCNDICLIVEMFLLKLSERVVGTKFTGCMYMSKVIRHT